MEYPSAESSAAVRSAVDRAKMVAADVHAPKLSEADTRAVLIDPLLRALGYEDVTDITREYYVRTSQEFIDYVIRVGGRNVLAVEAKSLSVDLTEKAASQLIAYCAVDGIPWGVLTNGRLLKLYNAATSGDVATKLVATIDLFSYHDDSDFAEILSQLWILSRSNMSDPGRLTDWVAKRAMDGIVREWLCNPASNVVGILRRDLRREGIDTTRHDIAEWAARALMGSAAPIPPSAAAQPKTTAALSQPHIAPTNAPEGRRMRAWVSLVESGAVGSQASLRGDWDGELVEASVDSSGYITCRGRVFANPTAAATYIAGTQTDGWKFWRYEGRWLGEVRAGRSNDGAHPVERPAPKHQGPSLQGYRNSRWDALFASGRISLPAVLTASWEGRRFEATVTPEGHLDCEGKSFINPSAAATHLAGRPMSGWQFWSYNGRSLGLVEQSESRDWRVVK